MEKINNFERNFPPGKELREKSNITEILKQKDLIENQNMVGEFINSMPVYVCVLNNNRQIIYSNDSFNKFINSQADEILGKKPGDALGCVHALGSDAGCGTTEFCKYCGALQSILESYKDVRSIQECRISLTNHDSLDLLVWSTPLKLENYDFTIFAFTDISSEKRRKALERIFFHDVLNTSGGIKGFVDLLKIAEQNEIEEYIGITSNLTDKLIEEINAQRTLSAAENHELEINPQHFSTREFLEEIKLLFSMHEVTKGKKILISRFCEDKVILSDKIILRRIISNLTKNALEASNEGDTIHLSCIIKNGVVEFQVENPSFMPEEVQMQIFQRSYSTKGYGRGLGTYSVRLLSERYLKGSVNFISTPESGTIFKASYPENLMV